MIAILRAKGRDDYVAELELLIPPGKDMPAIVEYAGELYVYESQTQHYWALAQDGVFRIERGHEKQYHAKQSVRKTVAVDLDAVLATYTRWNGIKSIGEPLPYAPWFTRELNRVGFHVLIYTTRCNTELNPRDPRWATTDEQWRGVLRGWIREWCEKHDVYFDSIYAGWGKPVAAAYVDDRSVVCRPQDFKEDEAKRAHFIEVIERCKALAGK